MLWKYFEVIEKNYKYRERKKGSMSNSVGETKTYDK